MSTAPVNIPGPAGRATTANTLPLERYWNPGLAMILNPKENP
ncbi:hypothetical protein [Arthrobacter sp. fls2-241-R2A-172]|nr:hypothetical protein [Arthrobacter sp. fls2-241-R2A-172]